MICGLAVPFGKPSTPGVGGRIEHAIETIAPFAFSRSVETGRSLRTGRPIHLCFGHKRRGRKRWKLASTADGSLRIWQTSAGVYFSARGVDLPAGFSGVSIRLEAVRWRKVADHRWLLLEGGIRHVALLIEPDCPAYKETVDITKLLSGVT